MQIDANSIRVIGNNSSEIMTLYDTHEGTRNYETIYEFTSPINKQLLIEMKFHNYISTLLTNRTR